MGSKKADDPSVNWPRKKEAKEYLEKHKIVELLNNLTAQLIYHQPSSPKEFMIEQLDSLAKARSSRVDYPCLFDESNIQSVAQMMDPTGRGYITLAQYKEAMGTLGITKFEEKPLGADVDKILLDTFIRDAKLGLAKASATFSDKR